MTAYGLAHLRPPAELPKERLPVPGAHPGDARPLRWHFVVHGSPVQVMEGDSPGALVVIEFPSLAAAHEW